jgi:hypothetical protein
MKTLEKMCTGVIWLRIEWGSTTVNEPSSSMKNWNFLSRWETTSFFIIIYFLSTWVKSHNSSTRNEASSHIVKSTINVYLAEDGFEH